MFSSLNTCNWMLFVTDKILRDNRLVKNSDIWIVIWRFRHTLGKTNLNGKSSTDVPILWMHLKTFADFTRPQKSKFFFECLGLWQNDLNNMSQLWLKSWRNNSSRTYTRTTTSHTTSNWKKNSILPCCLLYVYMVCWFNWL